MLSLPHRSVPLVRSVCRTLYQWWTANEPTEVTSIRSQLHAEAMAFAEWLSCLKSFYWASRLLLVARPEFRWNDLDALLNSGHTILKEIHVKKIIIIEPLQGDQLVVPIRFVTSFEDIHHVVQLACRGTLGAKYIEDRRYQLGDAATNAPVNPKRFVEDCLEDGKAFEVAIKLVRTGDISLEDCPRCGLHHSEEMERHNGWIRWMPNGEVTSPPAIDQGISPQGWRGSQASIFMMLRRLDIMILELPGLDYPGVHYDNACQRLYGRPQPILVSQVGKSNQWQAVGRVDLGTAGGGSLVELGTGIGRDIQAAKDAAVRQAYGYLQAIYPTAGLPVLR
ncbi:hypothetical protein BKA70DRAFT_1402363 [Coprinopsis sp. MPI-PUGE-AT-0042]|nr:hypothetical protein BKA70DRAFT_1402363 [Coprinopsis sp. MPI-PUGE-AT-0042]